MQNCKLTYQQLRDRIVALNDSYRKGNPEVSDEEYDTLLETFKNLSTPDDYIELRESLFSKLEDNKIKHRFIMGSLEKIKAEDADSYKDWAKDYISENESTLVMAKVDGMSVRLKYKCGFLSEAASRGDGEFGQNILDKVKYLVPSKIDAIYKSIEIRGELVIFKKDFEALQEDSNWAFKNPRNATVGIIGKKDYSDDLKYVSFVPYEIISINGRRPDFGRYVQLSILKVACGFDNVVKHDIFKGLDNEKLQQIYEDFKDVCPYDIDGLVLCNKNFIHIKDEKLPTGIIAYKNNSLTASSTIIDVDWGMPSKDGKLVPVAVISPIELGGAIISRVTCYNAKYILDNGLAYGDNVIILKSGDIIPKIVQIVHGKDSALSKVELPHVCPCCGTELKFVGVHLVCENPECSQKTGAQAEQFIKKLGVKNVSYTTLKKLGIESISQLFAYKLPKSATKSVVDFYESLYKKLYSTPVKELLKCCNIEGISTKKFDKIWDSLDSTKSLSANNIDDLIAELREAKIDGIGESAKDAFSSNIKSIYNLILPVITNPNYLPDEPIVTESKEKLGKICFTGNLQHYSRSEASKLAEIAGYEVTNGIIKDLTYLVSGASTRGSMSSKMKKAIQLGISIINEKQFMELIKTNSENNLDILDL